MGKEPVNRRYAAIILSAGMSERMGVPKFSLMADRDKTFIEYLVNDYYNFGCREIIVVLNPDGDKLFESLNLKLRSKIRLAINEHTEWGRFYSLKTGARRLEDLNPAFVSNIDNPFAGARVLRKLVSHLGNFDYLFPSFNMKGGHPFLISKEIVFGLLNEPEDQIHLKEFLNRYPSKAVEVDDERVLVNVNTEEDYRNFNDYIIS